VLLGDILGVDQSPILAIEPNEDVEVAVLLVSHVMDHARRFLARVQDDEAVGVIDAGERLCGWRADPDGGHRRRMMLLLVVLLLVVGGRRWVRAFGERHREGVARGCATRR
jgi:hypothetical protein